MIVTFYNHKVPQAVVEHQKIVYDHFGLDINQVNVPNWETHGDAIDSFIQSTDFDQLTIVDIDCIPINDFYFSKINILDGDCIYAVAQKASHMPNSIIYASPACMTFTKNIYNHIGSPSFRTTPRGDCGAELTYLAREKGIEVRLLYPTHVEKEQWQLDGSIMFGLGTTYGDAIYHSFHARWDYQRFLDKCKSIVK